jgi:hypothetical protein
LKRHCRELSAEHATEVVETVADLFVNFIKSRSGYNATNQAQARCATTPTNGTGVSRDSTGISTGQS